MKSVFSKSKKGMIIFLVVCALLWAFVFFIIGKLDNKKNDNSGRYDVVFETSLISEEVKNNIELDNFSVDVQGMINDINSVTQKINDNIKGIKPDSAGGSSSGSQQFNAGLNISFDEDKNNYFVFLDVPLDDLPDISYEVQGVTLVIERVFRNKLTNKPDYLRHYTYELPGPVRTDKAVMRYQKGNVVITLPKA